VFDANITTEVIYHLVNVCSSKGISTFFEPTSVAKCKAILFALKMMDQDVSRCIEFISPNIIELRELAKNISENGLEKMAHWRNSFAKYQVNASFFEKFEKFAFSQPFGITFVKQENLIPLALKLLPFMKNIIVKCGPKGTLVVSRDINSGKRSGPHQFFWDQGNIMISFYPPPTVINSEQVVNVTGAGDSFVGVLVAGLLRDPKALHDPLTAENLIRVAQMASIHTLKSSYAVSPQISLLRLEETRKPSSLASNYSLLMFIIPFPMLGSTPTQRPNAETKKNARPETTELASGYTASHPLNPFEATSPFKCALSTVSSRPKPVPTLRQASRRPTSILAKIREGGSKTSSKSGIAKL